MRPPPNAAAAVEGDASVLEGMVARLQRALDDPEADLVALLHAAGPPRGAGGHAAGGALPVLPLRSVGGQAPPRLPLPTTGAASSPGGNSIAASVGRPARATIREAVELLQHPVAGVASELRRALEERAGVATRLGVASGVLAALGVLEAAHEALLEVDAQLSDAAPPLSPAAVDALAAAAAALDAAGAAVTHAAAQPVDEGGDGSSGGGDIAPPPPPVVAQLRDAHASRVAALQHRVTDALAAAVRVSASPPAVVVRASPPTMRRLWALADRLHVAGDAATAVADALRSGVTPALLASGHDVLVVTPPVVDGASTDAVEARCELAPVARPPQGGGQRDAGDVGSTAVCPRVVALAGFLRAHVAGLPHAEAGIAADPTTAPAEAAFAAVAAALWQGSDGLEAGLLRLLHGLEPTPGTLAAFDGWCAYRAGPLAQAVAMELELCDMGFTPRVPPGESSALALLSAQAEARFAYRWRAALLHRAQLVTVSHRVTETCVVGGDEDTAPAQPAPAASPAADDGGALGRLLCGILDGGPGTADGLVPRSDDVASSAGTDGGAGAASPRPDLPPGFLEHPALVLLRPAAAQPGARVGDGGAGLDTDALQPADFLALACRARLPRCQATRAAVTIAADAADAMRLAAAVAERSPHVARAVYHSARDALQQFTASLVEWRLRGAAGGGGNPAGPLPPPRLAALLHNDCLVLAHAAASLTTRYVTLCLPPLSPARDGAPPPPPCRAQPCSFADLLPSLRASAAVALVRQVAAVRDALLDVPPLDDDRVLDAMEEGGSDDEGGGGDDGAGGQSSGDDGAGEALRRVVARYRSQARTLAALAAAWGDVLPRVTFLRAIAHLVDTCLHASAAAVLGLPHVSERASAALAQLMRAQASGLPAALGAWCVPLAEGDAAGDAAHTRQPNLVSLLPHWRSHAAVAELLLLPLAEIRRRAEAGGYVGVLPRRQLARLVEALFQPSAQRAAVVQLVVRGG